MPIKKTSASWGAPTIDVECPYCEESRDYYDTIIAKYPFIFGTLEIVEEEQKLENIVIICENCEKKFGLNSLYY